MIALFEEFGEDFKIPTFGELKNLYEGGKINVLDFTRGELEEGFDFRRFSLSYNSDTPICKDEDIYDLGHEYHDYTWTVVDLHSATFGSVPFMLIFEDEVPVIMVPHYGGFFLFRDILIIYCPFSIISVNLLTNKCNITTSPRSNDFVEFSEDHGQYRFTWLLREGIMQCSESGGKIHYYDVSKPIMDLEPFRVD